MNVLMLVLVPTAFGGLLLALRESLFSLHESALVSSLSRIVARGFACDAKKPMAALENLVVVVTGASRGIGQAVAAASAQAGATVLAAARSFRDFSGRPAPGTVTTAPLDVTDEASVSTLFSWLDDAVGKIDVLVNNAGTAVWKPIDELTLTEWRTVVDTNLTGSFLCSREALKRMKRTGGGRIVTIGSVADRVALPDCGAYGAAKFGARGLSQVITEEGKAFRVFGTLVSLGAVATDLWKDREGFNPRDMLSTGDVADCVVDIARRPLSVRIDEVQLGPPKGIL
jgi:3-oxoacyl-[acyl-carrier protein] reductase